MKEAKESYRRKVEHKLVENNMREVLVGVKIITGQKAKNSTEGGLWRGQTSLTYFSTGLTNHPPSHPAKAPT